MNKKLLSSATSRILVFVICIAAVVLVFYIVRFSGSSISPDPALWGQFGDYVGGILNPIVAFAALVVLSITLGIQKRELTATLDVLKSQQYEATFFQLLEIHQKMVDGFSFGPMESPSARGRYALKMLMKTNAPQPEMLDKWASSSIEVYMGYTTTVKIILRHFDSNAQLTKKKDFNVLFSSLLDEYEIELLTRYRKQDDELDGLMELYYKWQLSA